MPKHPNTPAGRASAKILKRTGAFIPVAAWTTRDGHGATYKITDKSMWVWDDISHILYIKHEDLGVFPIDSSQDLNNYQRVVTHHNTNQEST